MALGNLSRLLWMAGFCVMAVAAGPPAASNELAPFVPVEGKARYEAECDAPGLDEVRVESGEIDVEMPAVASGSAGVTAGMLFRWTDAFRETAWLTLGGNRVAGWEDLLAGGFRPPWLDRYRVEYEPPAGSKADMSPASSSEVPSGAKLEAPPRERRAKGGADAFGLSRVSARVPETCKSVPAVNVVEKESDGHSASIRLVLKEVPAAGSSPEEQAPVEIRILFDEVLRQWHEVQMRWEDEREVIVRFSGWTDKEDGGDGIPNDQGPMTK